MAQEPIRALSRIQTRHLSPVATASSASSSRASLTNIKQTSKTATTTNKLQDVSADDRATAAFIRRVLCPHQAQQQHESKHQDVLPITALLPPLTSSNEVDLQLYAIIAIILKDVVYSWYSKITPDHAFVDEIVHIIAHCTRALEERARKSNMEALLLDDIPALFDAHVTAYRIAAAACLPGSPADANFIYHSMRPHPALEPVPKSGSGVEGIIEIQKNTRTYCHVLAQGLLAALLPTEDLQNPALRALVSEVLADLILGNFVITRICDEVFLYDTIRKVADVVQSRLGFQKWAIDTILETPSRLSHFGLLSTKDKREVVARGRRMKIGEWINSLFQYLLAAIIGIRMVVMALVHSRSLPSRLDLSSGITTPVSGGIPHSKTPDSAPQRQAGVTAIAAYQLWPALARYISLSARMPWLAGCISLADHYLLKGYDRFGIRGPDGRLDRILAYHVLRHIFPLSQHLPTILLHARLNLFPGNSLVQPVNPPPPAAAAPSRSPSRAPTPSSSTSTPPTTAQEKNSQASKSKRAAAFALLSCISQPIARIYFAPPLHSAPENQEQVAEGEAEAEKEARERRDIEAMVADVQCQLLDVWGNEYMNRHLVLSVLERVLVALVPELGSEEGRGIGELLTERGVVDDRL